MGMQLARSELPFPAMVSLVYMGPLLGIGYRQLVFVCYEFSYPDIPDVSKYTTVMFLAAREDLQNQTAFRVNRHGLQHRLTGAQRRMATYQSEVKNHIRTTKDLDNRPDRLPTHRCRPDASCRNTTRRCPRISDVSGMASRSTLPRFHSCA